MNNNDFNELAGRIEALTRVVLHMEAVLEDAGVMDGSRFTQGLRNSLHPKPEASDHLYLAQGYLQDLAEAIDDARIFRQSRGGQ